MRKFVTFHALTVAPLGLFNRDRANLPKEANFGGFRRGRWSSQFQKRHLLDRLIKAEIAPKSIRSQYTLAVEILKGHIASLPANDPDRRRALRNQINHVAHVVYETIFRNDADFTVLDKKGKLDDHRLETLRQAIDVEFYKQDDAILFGVGEIEDLRQAIGHAVAAVRADRELDESTEWPPADPQRIDRVVEIGRPHGEELRQRWEQENVVKGEVPALERAGIVAALCGRMWSTMPDRGVTNALAMGHAVTTHELWRDDDFVTLRDDLAGTRPDAGGAFLGNVWLVNGVYYRCLAVDTGQLKRNVGPVEDAHVAELIVQILDAFAFARQGAKDGLTAPYTKPSLLIVELSDAHSINASTAFFEPVRPGADGGVLVDSARRLLRRLDDHDRAYLRDRFPTARHLLVADGDLEAALKPLLDKPAGSPDEPRRELAGFPAEPLREFSALETWTRTALLGEAPV